MISRNTHNGSETVALSRGGIVERYISIRVAARNNPGALDRPYMNGATAVGEFVFGGRQFARNTPSRPLNWVQGDGCSGQHLAGSQHLAISGTSLTPIQLDGVTVGYAYTDAFADYAYLAGILPDNLAEDRSRQTRRCFERMEAALASVGLRFTDVIRTWLYLDHLLDWYGEFNTVRTAFFKERDVFAHLVPASTGIGGGNLAGAAILAGALAIRPKSSNLRIMAVPSPKQCPALDYRSSFSRAVEIQYPDYRQLLISGTASIAPDGGSAHIGDIDKQIDLTMRVVNAILQSRGMTLAHTTRAIAYFKDMSYHAHFTRWCQIHGMAHLPYIPAHAAVCRDDLLFEMELDAASENPAP